MKVISGLFLASVLTIACARPAVVREPKPESPPEAEPAPESEKPPIPVHIAGMTSIELCNRLISIDTLPTKDPAVTDPIYESLIAKGDEAISCLVENISDRTPMPDPRYSVPHWQHFVVGDAAVFILLDILSRGDHSEWKRMMIESLPPKSAEEWKTNGVYAYFNYVSEPANRKNLQLFWGKRLKSSKKE